MQFLLEPKALPSLSWSLAVSYYIYFFMGQQGLLACLQHYMQVPTMLRPNERKALQIIPVAAIIKATLSH